MFIDWLKDPAAERCYLIEIDYLLGGVLHCLRRSTHPFRSAASDQPPLQPYPDTLLSLPVFDRELTGAFLGASRVSAGEFELFLDAELLALLDNPQVAFAGQQLRVLCGDARWPVAQFGQILVGQIRRLDATSYSAAKLWFSDRLSLFERRVQSKTIASGPNEGKPVPLCFGQCFNISPVLLDPVTKRYQVHDGAVQAITQVRENGQPISYTADLSTGTFTLQYNAQGRVTADVQGALVGGQYLTTANQLVNYLVQNVMQLPAPVGAALPAYTLGLYLDQDSTVLTQLDQLTSSVGGAWFFNRLNQVVLMHFNGVGAATAQLTLDDIEDNSLLPVRRIAPAKSVSIGYQKNYTRQADGLAGVIREGSPELAVLYEQAESTLKVENAAVAISFPEAEDISHSTLLAHKADAQVEAQRRANLAAVPRTVYELAAFATPFAMQLGQSIRIDYPHYFNGGKDAVITRLTDLPTDNSARLEVWR